MNKMNDQIIEWKDPDGTIKKLNFDDDGNLIGKKSKEGSDFPTEQEVNTKYRYYEDPYGNQYRWTTHKQTDGKFHARYMKAIHQRGWLTYKKAKARSFTKKKSAIAWCLKRYLKAKERQENVIKARAVRKQARLNLKPKLTTKQISFQLAIEKRKHYEQLQKNLNKKIAKQIKTLKTRCKTYQKKINYYKKREVSLK